MSDLDFTEKEQNCLSDKDFLLTKQRIVEKITKKLELCGHLIVEEINKGEYTFNSRHLQITPKVSRGENYMGLPYFVLDYPRFFKKNDVVNYRILLWWANFISFSLHIEGRQAFALTEPLISKKQDSHYKGIYFCIGSTPWENHFETSNYLQVRELSSIQIKSQVRNRRFLKIAKKATLQEWPSMENLAIKNLKDLTELINLHRRS